MRGLFVLGLILTGCTPVSRSSDYFEAHPDEAQRIVVRCKVGDGLGDECDAAKSGLAARQAKLRQDLFKKSFE